MDDRQHKKEPEPTKLLVLKERTGRIIIIMVNDNTRKDSHKLLCRGDWTQTSLRKIASDEG